MGQGQLLAVGAALITTLALAAAAAAQGPAWRERWTWLHLEARRAEVRRALAGRDAAAHDAVAEHLAAPNAGVPFRPVAHALAHLRGVAADDAFVLRTTIGAYVLPEVVDPDAANTICRAAHVSVFLPFTVPLPGPLGFDVTVHDARGEQVAVHTITTATDERALRLGQPSVAVPGAGLPDGVYDVTVATRIAGEAPRRHDPTLRWRFHVQRGYQARAEAAMAAAVAAAAALPPAQHAWLGGAAAAVHRAFIGEPWHVRSDAVHEIDRLERVLANVDAGRTIDDGLDGDVELALPVGGGAPLAAVLRRASGAARPSVVFVGATPAYDPSLDRPVAPATRHPRWLAAELAGFGAGRDWNVVCIESPGVGRDFATALQGALPLLATITGGDDVVAPVLVCEREAAAVVALRLAAFRPLVSGFVFVGGGALAGPTLLAHADVPIRVNAERGAGEAALAGVLEFVRVRQQREQWRGDVAALSPALPPWTFGVPLLAPRIDTFARACFVR